MCCRFTSGARAKPGLSCPVKFCAGLPLPDGGVNLESVLSGYSSPGFAIGVERFSVGKIHHRRPFPPKVRNCQIFLVSCLFYYDLLTSQSHRPLFSGVSARFLFFLTRILDRTPGWGVRNLAARIYPALWYDLSIFDFISLCKELVCFQRLSRRDLR